MNALTLNIPEQMLLALLRASLQEMEVETACFRQAIAEDLAQLAEDLQGHVDFRIDV